MRLGHQSQGIAEGYRQVASDTGIARVPTIYAQREQEEHHAEQVLALGDPGDGFNVDGVESEKRGDHRATSDGAGSSPQYPKQQYYVDDVQQEIGLMMAAGVEAEHPAVQRVREPGERVPIGSAERRERPLHGRYVQSALHVHVVYNVDVIVIVEERMGADRVIQGNRDYDQAYREQKKLMARRAESCGWTLWLNSPVVAILLAHGDPAHHSVPFSSSK